VDFDVNRSPTDKTFCIRQISEKKSDYNGRVRLLFIDFENTYDPVWTEVLYNILMEYCKTMKLVRLIEMYSNSTYTEVRIGEDLRGAFSVQNGLKKYDL
jgi:hypothetical protein